MFDKFDMYFLNGLYSIYGFFVVAFADMFVIFTVVSFWNIFSASSNSV